MTINSEFYEEQNVWYQYENRVYRAEVKDILSWVMDEGFKYRLLLSNGELVIAEEDDIYPNKEAAINEIFVDE